MAGRVAGKVALVTGAGSGIGRACAQRLAAEGAVVVATDIDDAQGKQTVAAITDAGGTARYIHQDVTDESGWESLVQTIGRDQGGLHILVNNAGIGIGGSILDDESRRVAPPAGDQPRRRIPRDEALYSH